MSEKYKASDLDQAYFMTLTVTGWVDVFTRKTHCQIIIDSLDYCQRNKGLEIYGWCLMSNHLHLIGRTIGVDQMPEVIRDFKKFTSKEIIKQIQEHPESRREWMLDIFSKAADRIIRVKNYKFWQDGFQPKAMFGNSVVKQKLDYIHQNPVVGGVVSKPVDYMYSSARNYADLDGILEITVVDELKWL
jgi:REP element-mobilizing transposase RayT